MSTKRLTALYNHLSWKVSRFSPEDIGWMFQRARDTVLPSAFGTLHSQVESHSMCGYARLRGLYTAVLRTSAQKVPGDIVECGTARGGSSGLMALTLKKLGDPRQVWAFDTFEGIPAPTRDDPDYDDAKQYTGHFKGDWNEVKDFLAGLGVGDRVKMVKGLFQDTLVQYPNKPISVLHLDGDWYDSVRVCLDTLFDRVSPGGIIHVDDYGHWMGARKAVDEFLKKRSLDVKLEYVDYSGRQFVKPRAA